MAIKITLLRLELVIEGQRYQQTKAYRRQAVTWKLSLHIAKVRKRRADKTMTDQTKIYVQEITIICLNAYIQVVCTKPPFLRDPLERKTNASLDPSVETKIGFSSFHERSMSLPIKIVPMSYHPQ